MRTREAANRDRDFHPAQKYQSSINRIRWRRCCRRASINQRLILERWTRPLSIIATCCSPSLEPRRKGRVKDRVSRVHRMREGHKLETQDHRRVDQLWRARYPRFSLKVVLHRRLPVPMLTSPHLVRCRGQCPDSNIIIRKRVATKAQSQ